MVWAELFYVPYLTATGLKHPMRNEIIAAGEPDPDKVAAQLVGAEAELPQLTDDYAT